MLPTAICCRRKYEYYVHMYFVCIYIHTYIRVKKVYRDLSSQLAAPRALPTYSSRLVIN